MKSLVRCTETITVHTINDMGSLALNMVPNCLIGGVLFIELGLEMTKHIVREIFKLNVTPEVALRATQKSFVGKMADSIGALTTEKRCFWVASQILEARLSWK
jgi:hypothetical protein